MTEAALTISHLSIRDRNGLALVDDVSLSAPHGSVLTLIGETGSGKSLIAQAVFGLLPSELSVTGDIKVGGHAPIPVRDAKRLAALWRKQIMLIPQEPSAALDPTMRVSRQMALAGIEDKAIKSALAAFDLPSSTEKAYPFMLSGGMAQRVLVASALGVGAPIIVADEPTKGLDADRVTQAIVALKRLSSAGRSLFVITHDRRVAEELSGEMAIIRSGRIVEQGPSERILTSPTSDYARRWLDADPRHWPKCHSCSDRSNLALSAHDLAFGWPGQPLLFRDLNLHLPKGGVLGISGPSGSGKSTLGDILLGLRKPLAGSIEWAGVDITKDPLVIHRHRQRYQKLHQDPIRAFAPHLTLERQLGALEEVKSGLRVARDLPPLLDRLQLRSDLLRRRPAEISGGEAQRLALARVLLLEPAAIVSDEPTSRLDPVVQRETMLLLRSIVEQKGLGLVLISHDKAILRAIADDRLDLGQI